MLNTQSDQALSLVAAPRNQHTLLIIDDDTTLSRLLCSALKTENYDIVTADNAESGILAASQLHPAIILLDLCLPDLDGLTVLEKIRQQDSQSKVVLTSCLPVIQWENRARVAGANAILEKPYNLCAIHKILDLQIHSSEEQIQ